MRAKYLDEAEIAALRRVMRPEAWLPFQLSLETGLRVGDIVGLQWDNLHGRELRYVAQKTGKRGSALLSEETARQLREKWRKTPSRWIFPAPTDTSKHISRQSLWKRLKRASQRAGISPRGVSPHSLRKVYGVREYRAHGLAAAQAGLQHTDISTTEIYVLADWLTEENGSKPLLRSDLARIIRYIADWLDIPFQPPRGD